MRASSCFVILHTDGLIAFPPAARAGKTKVWKTISGSERWVTTSVEAGRPWMASVAAGGGGDRGRRSLLTANFKKLCCNFFSLRLTGMTGRLAVWIPPLRLLRLLRPLDSLFFGHLPV